MSTAIALGCRENATVNIYDTSSCESEAKSNSKCWLQ